MEISENTLLTEIYLQNFVVSQLHGLMASQDVKVDPAVHTQNRLWSQCCWSVLLLLVGGALDCDDSEELLYVNFRIKKKAIVSLQHEQNKPKTNNRAAILLWTILDGGGKFWSNMIPDKKI